MVVAVAATLALAALGLAMLAAHPASAREPVAIAPGLYGVEAGRVWAYGASSRDGVLLFDAGSDPEGRALERLLAAMGAGRERVTHVFLTHGHSNHVAGAAGFPRARVWGGGADGDLFAGRRRPLEPLQFVQSWFRSPPVITVTDPLEERTAVDVGGAEVLAIPVPGHTAGSFAYLYGRTLFVGDVLHVDGGRFVHTTRFVGRDEEGTERSLLALVEAVRGLDFDRICTGHGGCTPAGDARALLQAFVGR
ncbi:MAG TPA: MBL fold metallo-hydrolase [Anaeromyxobacteraceae bacterium]|nr:MBL fold metallo-hydrolase [Anaeromyxobacteraceae bacterium]